MTKIAKKDFATRTRRIRAGMPVTDEMLADAAMSAADLAAKGFIEEAGAGAAPAPHPAEGAAPEEPAGGEAGESFAKPAKRR